MPIDVLHVVGSARVESTGIARIVEALVRGIDPKRYRASVWFLGEDGPLADRFRAIGAQTRVIHWTQGIRDPVGACRFFFALREYDFVIVHQHFGARSLRWIVRRATRGGVIAHVHVPVGPVVTPIPGMTLEESPPCPLLTEGADAAIAVSKAVGRFVRGVTPQIVYPGIPLPDSVSSGSSSGCIVGVACRLVPSKGVVYLIRAVASLRPEFPGLRLEIAGSGSEQSALEREVTLYKISNSVKFLGWQEDMTTVLANWDIAVQCSLAEGLPVTLLEAMAAGVPVVATAVGGTPELVEDGCTGLLVPPRDSQALADRLRALLLNPEHRRSMGAAGRAHVSTSFSADRMVAAISLIYDNLVGQIQFDISKRKPRWH